MPLIAKDFATLSADTVSRLISLGWTDAQFQGTGIRTITECIDFHLAQDYTDLSSNLSTQYLSTAKGADLAQLVAIAGILPQSGESDNALRVRAARAVASRDKSSQAAISTALSNLAQVRQVIPVPFTYGIGSVTYYLVGVNGIPSNATLQQALTLAQSQISGGGFVTVDVPKPLLLNIQAVLGLPTSQVANAAALQAQAINSIVTYLNTLTMGSTFFIEQIVATVLNNGSINEIELQAMSTTDDLGNTVEQLLADITPEFNQLILPGAINVSS